MTLKEHISVCKQKMSPYRDILLFVVALLGADAIWKMCIVGEEHIMDVSLLGLWDITAPFAWLAEHTAYVVAAMLSVFRDTVTYEPPYYIFFDSGFAVTVVWGCTPIKQSFIWLVIILLARGSWLKKTWFIPLGWACSYLFNLLRIFLIDILCEYHPNMFPFWHEYVFKYLFYGMLFLLWVLWVEKITTQEAPCRTGRKP